MVLSSRRLFVWLLALSAVIGSRAARAQTESLVFAPVADTFVDANAPTANLDSDSRLRADASPQRISYLRFAVTGVNGRPVQQARLRLQVTGPSLVTGGSIHRISNVTWDPATTNWNNRPAVDGPIIETLGPAPLGAIMEFTLDPTITADGVYSFAIDTVDADSVTYVSSASTTGQKPALVLTVATTTSGPSVTVLQPAGGATFFTGDAITFQGQATDAVDGDLSASLAWTSNLQGLLGTGASLTTGLIDGNHVITASTTNSAGAVGSAQIGVTVKPPPGPNTAPLVAITAPLDGQTVTAGQAVAFTGTANDLEDGALTAGLAWTSDRDGALGTGGSFTHALTAGTHHVIASVTDSGGLVGSATVTVTAQAPLTMEFPAVADTYADSGVPTATFGSDAVFRVDANVLRVSYLRFAVSGVANAVSRAILRLQVDGASGAASDSGGQVYAISDTTWDEATLTFNNRPAVDGAQLATTGAVKSGQVVDFDVTAAVHGDGLYAFAMMNQSSDGVDYRSREGGPAPKLVLTLAGNAPVVAVTAPPDGTTIDLGTPLTCSGTATDTEDGNLSAALAWTSSLDGPLGTGASITASALTAGTHAITAAVTDSSGLTGQARVSVTVRAPNQPPTVTITSPANGASVALGTSVTLAASALDDFDGNVSAGTVWTSSLDGPLGTGATLAAMLSQGVHLLSAAATDSSGAVGQAYITVSVGSLPSVSITTPADGTSVVAGTPIVFAGSAADATDGDLSGAIAWTSSLDGALGTGASIVTSGLRAGSHVITARVVNAAGLSAQAQIGIVVRLPNTPPVVTIVAPPVGTTPIAGTPVVLSGTALDDFDGDLSGALTWTSSLQGVVGHGAAITTTLVEGIHVLTASVTDSGGLQGSAQRSLTVLPATTNLAPMVLMVAPRDGRQAALGETITFFATADDREDGLLASRLTWTSDRDGVLGSGPGFSRTLSLGIHHVTAQVSDSGGLVGTASATVTIVAPAPLTFTSVADTYVSSSAPSKQFATASTFYAQGSPIKQGFLRFTVRGVAPWGVVRARVRLTVGGNSADGSPMGGTLYGITNNSWPETITYSTRPAVDGPALATAGAVKPKQVVEFDVTPFVRGDGTFSFALLSTSTDSVRYRSRESSTGKPQLILDLGTPRIALTGTHVDDYYNGSLLGDAIIDASAATYLGSSTNSYPLDFGGGPGVWLLGAAVYGQYDRSLTWSQMHTDNNAAVVFDDAQFTIDGLRADDVTDGIRPQSGNAFAVRNTRLSYVRDDCVENDHLQAGLVDDSLFDGCYSAFSARPSAAIVASGANGSNNVWRIQNTLVRLQPMPGPDGTTADGLGHGGFFKWDNWSDPTLSLSPKLALHDNVFMAERVGVVGASRMGIPPGRLVSCSNNVMVWLGDGDYPAPLPSCFTVTKDRAVWDAAVADWIARHPGVRP